MMAVKRVVVWVGKIISVVADDISSRLSGLAGHMCLLSPGVDVVCALLGVYEGRCTHYEVPENGNETL